MTPTPSKPVTIHTPVGTWVACLLLIFVCALLASTSIGARNDHREDMILACSQIPYFDLPDVCDPYLEGGDAE